MVEKAFRTEQAYRKGGQGMKRYLAALVVGLMIVPFAGTASAGYKERVNCFFYQTFEQRDPTDCVL
jgi:hypothetical protein